MAMTSPENFDVDYLRERVTSTYERVALEPSGSFHFHRGPEYAAGLLGYDAAELGTLPEECTARFAGVGNPLGIPDREPHALPLRAGEVVLDHACGAGMDLLLAARRVGPTGHAIGVDMTQGMRRSAARSARLAGLDHRVEIQAGYMECLPLVDESVDAVISNGVVNLAPDKGQVFREIARVLRPGGRLYLADVVVQRELTMDARADPDLWAACIAGALVESELADLAAAVGLRGARVVERFDCFRGTSAEAKVAQDLFVHGVSFYACKEG